MSEKGVQTFTYVKDCTLLAGDDGDGRGNVLDAAAGDGDALERGDAMLLAPMITAESQS